MSMQQQREINELKQRVADLELSRPRFGELTLILERIIALESERKALAIPEKRKSA